MHTKHHRLSRRRLLKRLAIISGASIVGIPSNVSSQSRPRHADPHLGFITLVRHNFAMQGYAECNGTLLLISENSALYSLLGTGYGGDGNTTFALPNLTIYAPARNRNKWLFPIAVR